MGWLWWVGLALALGVIEMLTVDLMFLMLGGGAIAGAIAGALGAPFWAQAIIAAAVAGLLLLLVRPWAKKLLDEHTPKIKTGTAAHVGRNATVVRAVSERAGRVKLHGEVWTARAAEPGTVIPVGAAVTVIRIEGATAVVSLREQPSPQDPYGTSPNQ
ncbi:MAG TPA: NfeD family protein [Beutenbergiaceae bacterium]|nr:NfeD family protein [Beutenbergiaceae bacterium]